MPLQRLDTLVRSLLRRAGTRGDDSPDGALLEQFLRTRDETAFTALVGRHGPMVYAVCRRVLRHAQDAEDAFQATFLIFARRAADLRRADSVAGWLHTVATRLALRARADAARRPVADGGNLDMLPAEPDTTSLWHDLRPVLDEELQRLPEKYRVPVILCYLEGCTHADAARQLGWPKGTVAGRLARARELLRDRLTRRGVTLSSALLGSLLADHAAAALPAGLANAAVRGALAFAASSTTGISSQVLALAEGGLQAMFAAKVKVGAMLIVTLTFALAGAGVWAHQALHEKPEEPSANAEPQRVQEGKPQVRMDRYGDPLPEGAVARLGTVRWRRMMAFGKMVLSPDGKTVAVDEGGRLALLEMSTGKPLHRFYRPGQVARRPVGFSKDGKRFFSIEHRGTVRVWDVGNGQEMFHYVPDHRNDLAVLSTDGTILASYWEAEIRLTEADTGKELRILENSKAASNEVYTFSPDGKYVAGRLWESSEGRACLWDVATGKRVRTLVEGEPGKDVVGMAFSSDSRLVATGSKAGLIQLWDVATGKEVRRLSHKPTVGEKFRAPRDNENLAFTRDGKSLISGGSWSPIRVWDIAAGREVRRFADGSEGFLLLPDDKRLAVLRGQVIALWDFTSGTEIHPPDSHQASVWTVAFRKQDGTLLSADGSGELRFWDMAAGRSLRSLQGVGRSSRLAPDGQVFAIPSEDDQPIVVLRETATGKEVRRILLQEQGRRVLVSIPAFSQDGARIAISYGDWTDPRLPPITRRRISSTFGVWETATGKELWRQTDVGKGPVAFSPDGALLAFSGSAPDGVLGRVVIELWDAVRGHPLYLLGGAIDSGGPLAFSPNGKLLVKPVYDRGQGADNDAVVFRLWEVATGQERAVIKGHRESQYVVAFSPDGRTLATTGSDRGASSVIRLWDIGTGEERAALRGHAGVALCLTFSPDGRYLVSGSADTTLLVWDLARILPPKQKLTPPSAKEVEAAWADLARDAMAAHRAIHTLASAPGLAVPLLKERLKPAPVIPAGQLAQWVRDLDDARFEVRERARGELEKADLAAEEHLAKALAGKPSLEVRQQVETLQKKSRGPVTRADLLRDLRAVEVLELIGTAEARDVLKKLAEGATDARLTREARATLQLLEKR